MDPFELFESQGIYKVVMLYFSRFRGLAIVGRTAAGDNVEVLQYSGDVDPSTGNFTALDYTISRRTDNFPVITKDDFEKLVSFIAEKIDDQTRMSVVEPEVIRMLVTQGSYHEPGEYVH